MKKTRRHRRSPAEIAAILDEFRKSGLSQSAFCSRCGIPASSLANWLRRERSARSKSKPEARRLVPVRVVDHPAPTPSAPVTLEAESASGYAIRFPAGLDPDLLARYLHALEGRC